MVTKDFMRLALGEYQLTDGIYTYNLKKMLTEDGGRTIYRIVEAQFGGTSLCLFEGFEGDDSDKYKYPILTGVTSVGGIGIHSDSMTMALWNLKMVPKFSLKQYLNQPN